MGHDAIDVHGEHVQEYNGAENPVPGLQGDTTELLCTDLIEGVTVVIAEETPDRGQRPFRGQGSHTSAP